MPVITIKFVYYKVIKGFIYINIFTLLFFIQICMAQNTDSCNPYRLNLIKTTDQYQQQFAVHGHGFADLKVHIPSLILDLIYCSSKNFTNQQLYPPIVTSYLQEPAADALKRIQEQLLEEGLSLKIWDAYRPYQVSRKMWAVVPDARYAADPAIGSGHNRGIAVDLTIVAVNTGKELDMGTEFDNFTEKAHHDFTTLPKNVLTNRMKLRKLMEAHGFRALETEWWHYYWSKGHYELMDFTFEELEEICKQPYNNK